MYRDEATQGQLDRIARLLDERCVTGRVAERIITMLLDCPAPNSMGHNKDILQAVKERVEREDK
jgi:hypothetical protein